jgi:hypothetical protein
MPVTAAEDTQAAQEEPEPAPEPQSDLDDTLVQPPRSVYPYEREAEGVKKNESANVEVKPAVRKRPVRKPKPVVDSSPAQEEAEASAAESELAETPGEEIIPQPEVKVQEDKPEFTLQNKGVPTIEKKPAKFPPSIFDPLDDPPAPQQTFPTKDIYIDAARRGKRLRIPTK